MYLFNESDIINSKHLFLFVFITYFSLFYVLCFIILYFEVQYDSDSYCHYCYFIKKLLYKDLNFLKCIFSFQYFVHCSDENLYLSVCLFENEVSQ